MEELCGHHGADALPNTVVKLESRRFLSRLCDQNPPEGKNQVASEFGQRNANQQNLYKGKNHAKTTER
ncbi:MAG: hypothetical protein OXE85_02370 [Roseovarius sp.]|nr:hypothetical protein [Roseovarius sp.]MCY4315838.1 hypothetical protein [Roseovarius sp.]